MNRKNQLVLAVVIALFANINTASACGLAALSGPMLSSIIFASPFFYSSELSQAVGKGLSNSLQSLSSFKNSHSNGEETAEERNNRAAYEVAMAKKQADEFIAVKGNSVMETELSNQIKNYKKLLQEEQGAKAVSNFSDLEIVEGYLADMHRLSNPENFTK
jgi:hypothetical protein